MAAVRDHYLDDAFGWKQEPECVVNRSREPVALAGLDHIRRELGHDADEYSALDRVRAQLSEVGRRVTEEDQIALTRAFERWFRGNAAAMRFCADMTEIAHTWDDLVDADKPVSSAEADRIFRKLVLEVPANEFYRANFGFLHPVLVMVWGQWDAANSMETHPIRGDREKAFMLRASLYQLFHACAVVCGGLDWAAQIGPEIYRFYGESLESFDA